MTANEKFRKMEIDLLTITNEAMFIMATNHGFISYYNYKLQEFPDPKRAFRLANEFYKSFFGEVRYSSYEKFYRDFIGDHTASIVARTMLLKWFCSKGFKSAESFVPVIRIHRPDVAALSLIAFWEGDYIQESVLDAVNNVYQILS